MQNTIDGDLLPLTSAGLSSSRQLLIHYDSCHLALFYFPVYRDFTIVCLSAALLPQHSSPGDSGIASSTQNQLTARLTLPDSRIHLLLAVLHCPGDLHLGTSFSPLFSLSPGEQHLWSPTASSTLNADQISIMSDFIYNVSGNTLRVPGLSLHVLDNASSTDVVEDTTPPAPCGTGQHPLSSSAMDDMLLFSNGTFLFPDEMWGVPSDSPANDNGQSLEGSAASVASASGNQSDNDADDSTIAPRDFVSPAHQFPGFARTGAKCPVGLALLGYASIRHIMASSLSPRTMLNSIAAVAFSPSNGATADEVAGYNGDTDISDDEHDDEDDDDDEYHDVTAAPTTPPSAGKGYRNSAGEFSGKSPPKTPRKYAGKASGKPRGQTPPSSSSSGYHTIASSFMTPTSAGHELPSPATSPLSASPTSPAYSLAPCENTRSRDSHTSTSVSVPPTTTAPRKKAIQMRWTSDEHALVRTTLQAIVKNNTASTEQRFELVANALNAKFLSQYQAKYGPDAKRTKWSVKNQVTRVTRAMDKEAGIDFDDRKARKDGKERAVITSARPNKKRGFGVVDDDDEVDDDGSDDDEEVSPAAKRQRLQT